MTITTNLLTKVNVATICHFSTIINQLIQPADQTSFQG
jgi:hypothetical protein